MFGLGLDWHTGVTTADGAVPVLDGADKAAATIGQGEIRLNTLNLASLTATIQDGSFKQPTFGHPKTSRKAPARALRPLSGHAADDLRALMRAYAQDTGTSGAAFGGVAEQFHDSAEPVIGWFTAYRGDLAIPRHSAEQAQRPETAGVVVRAVLGATTGLTGVAARLQALPPAVGQCGRQAQSVGPPARRSTFSYSEGQPVRLTAV